MRYEIEIDAINWSAKERGGESKRENRERVCLNLPLLIRGFERSMLFLGSSRVNKRIHSKRILFLLSVRILRTSDPSLDAPFSFGEESIDRLNQVLSWVKEQGGVICSANREAKIF